MTKRFLATVAGSRAGLLFSESWYLHWLGGIPIWLRTVIISMIPVVELRGAIPAAKYWGAGLGTTFFWALLGNMLPIPFILLLLGPISDWLRRRSRIMDRFFSWLFARTRRKHGRSFERWRDAALCLFVAIPLPGTGAWTGALAAFVFDVPFSHALPAIFLGVLIAGAVVTLVVYFVSTVPLWVTLVSATAMLLLLLSFWWASRREEEVEERQSPERG